MFVNLNIPSFGELLRKYVYNFRNRLGDNVIIRGIYLSHITFQSGIWDWWRDILSPQPEHCSVYITVFYLFFKILIYIISIFCKLLYGLCFRNKHIIQLKLHGTRLVCHVDYRVYMSLHDMVLQFSATALVQ